MNETYIKVKGEWEGSVQKSNFPTLSAIIIISFNKRWITCSASKALAVSPGRDDSLQKAQGNLPIRSAR
ncbi:hypothetical protein BMR07_11515 [Methylococcaceae bacterium CS1]|nr:hypothetical protein BMR10_13885 [Methylococcaceae bacterium CS4]TXL04813.1 hypothetical protein BMR07_11515 [Methylococcaceae bacterium CS1]